MALKLNLNHVGKEGVGKGLVFKGVNKSTFSIYTSKQTLACFNLAKWLRQHKGSCEYLSKQVTEGRKAYSHIVTSKWSQLCISG